MNRDAERVAALIERLEAATGADRELDAEISAFIAGGTVDREGRFWKPGVHGFCIAPQYSASIDAALTLVQDSDVWGLSLQEEGYYQASVMPLGPGWAEAKAPTAALALCIAALRALQDRKP